MPNPTSPTPPAESWAEVRAHNQVMRYRRTGAGRSVLVLRPERDAVGLWPELAGALGARFRVIEPTLPVLDPDVVAWLAGFLDGLGPARVALVASGDLCLPALELARLDPERVVRAVLVPADGHDVGGASSAFTGAAHDPAVPLLVAPRGTPAGEAVPRVTDFLDGDWATAPG